jgi:hypothetical protein
MASGLAGTRSRADVPPNLTGALTFRGGGGSGTQMRNVYDSAFMGSWGEGELLVAGYWLLVATGCAGAYQRPATSNQ